MRRRSTLTVLALVTALALVAPSATATPAANRAPVDTGQNLPALNAPSMYMVGAGMAPVIEAYRASGAYQSDQARIARLARVFFDRTLAECRRTPGCKPAVVFDIDDTLVSWYAVYASNQFAVSDEVWGDDEVACATPVIRTVKALYDHARAKGATPFLITGRGIASRAVTQRCLAERGIGGYRELVMRSPSQESLTAAVYKERERKRITEQGWTILLSIGDQYSDSAGKYSGGKFVLPNPMYFIP
jgi:predicted secreted acid phosphatase